MQVLIFWWQWGYHLIMKNFLANLFRANRRTPVSNDMRETPIDNPLDFREDGSIQPGDPAYDALMSLLDSDAVGAVFTQEEDGTWTSKTL